MGWQVMLSQLPQGEASRGWRERESDVLAMDLQQVDDQSGGCFAGFRIAV